MGKTISHADQIIQLPGANFLTSSDFREGPPAREGLWWDRNRLFRGPAGIGNVQVGVNFKIGREPVTIEQTAATGIWEGRDGARILFLGDTGYILGGWNGTPRAEWGNKKTTNQVWVTRDYGATIELLLPHSDTPVNQFRRKHTFGALVKEGYMYVLGGDHEDDVFGNSECTRSGNGSHWEVMAANGTPGWHGQVLTGFGLLNGEFHAVGGQFDLDGAMAGTHWKSTDDTATWSALANPPFSPRAVTMNLPEWRGEMWWVCGGIYNSGRVYYNGVFAYNGSAWRTVLPDGNNQLPPVMYQQVFKYDDRLWMVRGYNHTLKNSFGTVGNQDAAYWTETGDKWYKHRGPLQLPPSHADGAGVGPDGVLFISGNYSINGYPKTSHKMTRI